MATTQSTPGQIEFLIKKYPGGKFSGLLDDGISVGDEMSLTGPVRIVHPQGRARPAHRLHRRWRGDGAGAVAPATPERDREPRPVRFYYGARTAADLFYIDEILDR